MSCPASLFFWPGVSLWCRKDFVSCPASFFSGLVFLLMCGVTVIPVIFVSGAHPRVVFRMYRWSSCQGLRHLSRGYLWTFWADPLSPPSEDKHRYILTVMDVATCYPEAIPLIYFELFVRKLLPFEHQQKRRRKKKRKKKNPAR